MKEGGIVGLLEDKDKEQLVKLFERLENGVTLVMFTQEFECQYCQTTRELLEEVAELSDKISIEVHDFVEDAELAETYGVDKIPATVVLGDRDYGIRFFEQSHDIGMVAGVAVQNDSHGIAIGFRNAL